MKNKIIRMINITLVIILMTSLSVTAKQNIKSTIVFGKNKTLKVSGYYKNTTEKNIKQVQGDINKDKAIAIYNELDNNDNKLTYIAGHNPGIMSELAKFVKNDREVKVYDKNGNYRYYKLKFLIKCDYNKGIAHQDVINFINENQENEAILIQFCRNKKLEYWTAIPKEENNETSNITK